MGSLAHSLGSQWCFVSGELPACGRDVGGAGAVPAAEPAILQQLLRRTQEPPTARKTLRIQASIDGIALDSNMSI